MRNLQMSLNKDAVFKRARGRRYKVVLSKKREAAENAKGVEIYKRGLKLKDELIHLMK